MFLVGDLMIEMIKKFYNILHKIEQSVLEKYLGSISKKNDYILLTLHRAENVDNDDWVVED